MDQQQWSVCGTLVAWLAPHADARSAIHPPWRPPQVLLLTGCIAESGGLKKRDKAALLAQVANNLQAMRLDGEPGAGA